MQKRSIRNFVEAAQCVSNNSWRIVAMQELDLDRNVPVYICVLIASVWKQQAIIKVFCLQFWYPFRSMAAHGFPDIKHAFYNLYLTRSSKLLVVFKCGSWSHSVHLWLNYCNAVNLILPLMPFCQPHTLLELHDFQIRDRCDYHDRYIINKSLDTIKP